MNIFKARWCKFSHTRRGQKKAGCIAGRYYRVYRLWGINLFHRG